MKKSLSILLMLAVVFLTACSGAKKAETPAAPAQQPAATTPAPAPAPQPKVTIKLGHINPVDAPIDQSAKKFAQLVNQKSGGSITVEVFPASQLGNEKAHAEGVKMGTVDMVSISSGGLAIFLPQLAVFDAGYLFRDDVHQQKVVDGAIGQEMKDKMLAAAGIRIVGFYYQGFRNLTTKNKMVKTPEDLAGLKIRTPDVKVYAETMKAMGGTPTPMAVNELFTALQTGVVEGQENPLPTIVSHKFYEVQKYVHLTGHMASVGVVAMNDKVWQKLTPEQQKALNEAAKETMTFHHDVIVAEEKKATEELKKQGITIVEVDREPFRKRVQAALPAIFEKDWGKGLYEKIQEVK